jgi:hypothetical protein
MMRNILRSFGLAVLIAAASSLNAATVYVAQNAPGPAHDGKTWQTALPTVEAGLAAANAGDEVWVAAGVYPTHATVARSVGLYGGFIGRERFREERPGLPSLTVLTNSVYSTALTITATAGAAVVDGFTFQQTISRPENLIVTSGAAPRIAHNVFTMRGLPAGRVIASALLACTGGAPIIVDNVFTAGVGTAIRLQGTGGTIANNTIAGNAGAAIERNQPVPVTIANNIIAFNQLGFSSPTADGITLRNNCFYGNATGDFSPTVVHPVGADTSVTADPRLASYAFGNLHIQPDSPCVDAGSSHDLASDQDVDLLPRVIGAGVDIGADESDGRRWVETPRVVRVSTSGNDANDGASWDHAKRTVRAALDAAAVTGGEVWVAEGSYNSPPDGQATGLLLPTYVYLYGGFAGSETSREQRDWAAHPTFLAADAARMQYFITAAAGQWVSAMDGFVISGGGAESLTGAMGFIGASPLVRNNVFTGWFSISTPVISGENSSGVVFNNAFAGNGIAGRGLVYSGGGALSLLNNLFVGNASSGTSGGEGILQCMGGSARIANNLFDGNATRADSALLIALGATLSVTNNTFVHNQGGGLVNTWLPPMTFANNVGAFNSFQRTLPVPSTAAVHNNNLYQSGAFVPPLGHGNVADYPGFADLFHENYRLAAGSPGIDAGDDAVVEPGMVDLDGHPRIQGAHVDMGAYEFAAPGVSGLDPVEALKIAGGLRTATPNDIGWLDATGQTHGLTLMDVVTLLRALKGN